MKICKYCFIEKSLIDFVKHKNMPDGHENKCKECKAKSWKKYYNEKRKDILKSKKEYRKNNKEKIKNYMGGYRKENKDKIQKQHYEYCVNKLKTDINYKISHYLRARIRLAIKNNQKVGSAVKDLGCSLDYLKDYFETMFYLNPETNEMMTWENYGEWHIDHIIPLVSFDLADREQFLKACHYTNLQPLWAKDNLKKSDKYDKTI